MRLYGTRMKVTNRSHKRYGQEGQVITYKFYQDKVALLIRFETKMELLYHDELEINQEDINEDC